MSARLRRVCAAAVATVAEAQVHHAEVVVGHGCRLQPLAHAVVVGGVVITVVNSGLLPLPSRAMLQQRGSVEQL